MKNAIILTVLLILVAISSAMSQTIYTVKSSTTTSALKMPTTCENCVVNISKGATLTFSQDHNFKTLSITGGNVIIEGYKFTIWDNAVSFTNTNVTFRKSASLISSGPITANNSVFSFLDNSTATFWRQTDLTKTTMKFLADASMVSTAAFNMYDASALIAGDGSKASTAFIKFDGGTLSEYGNSYVTVLNTNNYYYNWNNYNGNGTSYRSTNNNMNCGVSGRNACQAQYMYGPATANTVGISSNATMPVKLSNYSVVAAEGTVSIKWSTDLEQKSSHFNIEKSIDGINWTIIGKVDAQGNSSTVVNYNFTDNVKSAGVISYRLNMVDQDLSAEYSPIKSVKVGSSIAKVTVYPNPTTDFVNIATKNNQNKISAQLISFNGQVVKSTTGNGNMQMNLQGMVAGTYVLRVTDATGAAENVKLMIK